MTENKFDPKMVKERIIKWIREWFEVNGNGCNAVIGISGGKDSSICAALCVEALGKDRVVGVLMPNITQDDIIDSYRVVEFLGIQSYTIPITLPVASIHSQLEYSGMNVTNQTAINLPARIRMSVLYAVSQSLNGRVINTCNLSENWIGYSTRYGDDAGDMSPLGDLTVKEIKMLGRELGLPIDLVDKTPSDGLCGKTDEDNFGFSYDALDNYILNGECSDEEIRAKIDDLHKKNLFKTRPMPTFIM